MTPRHAALLVLTLLLASVGSAQDWNITGAGARAEGFGGAFIGVADDATAIVWNPGGLGQLERAEVSAVGRYIVETSEFKSMLPSDSYTESNKQTHFNFNFASLAVPFSLGNANLVLAVAYQTQLDFYSKYTDIGKNVTESEGAASTVTPGAAIRFGSAFSLGFAANIWMGSFDYTTKYASGSQYKMSPEFSGLNFGIGALIDFGGMPAPIPLKLGAAVKTPFILTAEADYTSDGTTGKTTTEIEMPAMLGFGASVRLGENFTLALDYELRLYEDKKITTTEEGSTQPGVGEPLSDSDENLNQFRVGAEYLIVTKGGVIPIRAGFRTVPTVFANFVWDRDNQVYNPTDQVSGIGYAVGTGFISGSFALDFAYSREQSDEQTWTDSGITDFTSNYTYDRFSLSLIIYF